MSINFIKHNIYMNIFTRYSPSKNIGNQIGYPGWPGRGGSPAGPPPSSLRKIVADFFGKIDLYQRLIRDVLFVRDNFQALQK